MAEATAEPRTPPPGVGSTFAKLGRLLASRPGTMAASIALGLAAALSGLAWQGGVAVLIIEALEPAPDRVRMGWIVAAIAALVAVGRLAFLASTALSHLIAIDVQRDLRLRIAEHLTRVPLSVSERFGAKALRLLIVDDIERVEDGIAHLVPEATANFTAPLVALVALMVLDWRLGLAAALPIVLGMVAMRAMTSGAADITRAYHECSADLASRATEYVAGLPTLRLFDRGDRALSGFREVSDRYLGVIEEWVRRVLGASALLHVCVTSGLLFVLPLGLWLLATDRLSAATFVLFIVFTPSLGALVTRLPNFAFRYAQQGEVLARLDALLAETPLSQAADPRCPRDHTVRFEGVGVRRGERAVLHGVDLVLEPGTVTALVGASGAGKTTLATMLMRFQDPDEGRITIGGIDLRTMSADTLHGLVGTVPQQSWLFSGTVADNLRLAAPDADAMAIAQSVAAAHASDFVDALPGGIDAPLEAGGANLSGGQRQRLCIARALLRNSPILVLDEATAAADPVNERAIQRGLAALARGRTTLVIAHRLASIVDADQIVVLDAGRIVERGTHDTLVALGGRYARFWSLQNDGTTTSGPASQERSHAATG